MANTSSSSYSHRSSYSSPTRWATSSNEGSTPASISTTISDVSRSSAYSNSSSTANQQKVVGIKVIKAGNNTDSNKLLTGDIVIEVHIVGHGSVSSTSGKDFLFKSLKDFSGRELIIKVKRQGTVLDSRAKLSKNKNLQDSLDPSHRFTFEDHNPRQVCERMQEREHECMKVTRVMMDYCSLAANAGDHRQIKTCYSMLVVPQSDNMDKAVSQAMSWFYESKNSGVPLKFLNIQTEPFVLGQLEQKSAIRIWFKFKFPEVKVELKAAIGAPLGLSIEKTNQGFCHVTRADAGAAKEAGLDKRLTTAKKLGNKTHAGSTAANAANRNNAEAVIGKKLLVITRVGKEKVLPWSICDGNLKCFSVLSIGDKLAACRDAECPASVYILDIPEMQHVQEDQQMGANQELEEMGEMQGQQEIEPVQEEETARMQQTECDDP
ncbi:hypothetical protein L7F22_001640 [Adiantum nelumboides]|nr:hypothetical protein [Adiantum nelumboides]